ncbi:MAG: ribosome biogenesis GTPase Der [SAR324 cluster bacterium]|uniref:GTPase Der n=1 Tax=SAR324 cluster bacterium TaxID=2024889 RepID=A0A2A4T7L9_9DELT|nr:MAG: ribosome biogenesis GTPase Der [SAR324 cluster bacterium]
MKLFALVGKPNVGKSTLFNRLARKRLAIVDPKPGITRDRNTALINYKGHNFILMDTGGFEPDSKEGIPSKMREQSQLAVEEADAIIFMLDRVSGWTAQDQAIYEFLRCSSKPIYFVVNKIDGEGHEVDAAEFYESGAQEIFTVSAAHGRGITGLLERLSEDFPEIVQSDQSGTKDDVMSVSIVGRPNVGKSSLTNYFLGEAKQIVHDAPGTTRDPVDNFCKYHGDTIRLIDTAGIRKKSRVSQLVDKYSMIAAIKSIERSDVVLLVVDATAGVVEQDARIAGYVLERGKALIIIVNKWDLVPEKDSKTLETMRQNIRDKVEFLSFAPIIFVSAKTGQRVPAILEECRKVYTQYTKRIQTSDVNKILESITARHTPPMDGRRKTKIYFGTQVAVAPPTFVLNSNNPSSINTSYRRYVTNQFRHFFGFEGTPIKIFWRDKANKSVSEE